MIGSIPPTDRNLILTGYTGPNQPALGRQVAERLKVPFIDIDQQIEDRTGFSIDDIHQNFGEQRLRTAEDEVMGEAVLRRNALIRVNGRTLLREVHYDRLRQTGPIICLVAQLDAVLHRLHLAMGARYHDPDERALALGHLRREWGVRRLEGVYELDLTYMPEDAAIEAVLNLWMSFALRG